MNRRIHKESIRFANNLGMEFPVCKKNDRLIDLDAGLWPTSPHNKEVTCKNCQREVAKSRWA